MTYVVFPVLLFLVKVVIVFLFLFLREVEYFPKGLSSDELVSEVEICEDDLELFEL